MAPSKRKAFDLKQLALSLPEPESIDADKVKPSKTARPEKRGEKNLLKRCALELGIVIQRKRNGIGHYHWPDRQLMPSTGRPIFVEMKAYGKYPTAMQHQIMCDLNKAGYAANWFDNEKEAFEWVKNTLKCQQKLTTDGYLKYVKSTKIKEV
jgi:hypothetical protein